METHQKSRNPHRDNKDYENLEPKTLYQQAPFQEPIDQIFLADDNGIPRNILTNEEGPRAWNYVPINIREHQEKIEKLQKQLRQTEKKIRRY